jgi:hypothetical protein
MDEWVSFAQELSQFCVTRGQVTPTDHMVVFVNNVDASAQQADFRLARQPGVLPCETFRKDNIVTVEARQQWCTGVCSGEVQAPRQTEKVRTVEPYPLVLLGPSAHETVRPIAAVIIYQDQLIVLEGLIGQAL